MGDELLHQRRDVLYEGQVQGVGFRFTVQRIARQYEVAGYVRNTPDGRVELAVEGPPEQLARFLEHVAEAMASYIRRADVQTSPAKGQFSGFDIRF